MSADIETADFPPCPEPVRIASNTRIGPPREMTQIDNVSDAIIFADREGVVHLWNTGSQRFFGFRAEEIVGKSIDQIITEKLRERERKSDVQLKCTQNPAANCGARYPNSTLAALDLLASSECILMHRSGSYLLSDTPRPLRAGLSGAA